MDTRSWTVVVLTMTMTNSVEFSIFLFCVFLLLGFYFIATPFAYLIIDTCIFLPTPLYPHCLLIPTSPSHPDPPIYLTHVTTFQLFPYFLISSMPSNTVCTVYNHVPTSYHHVPC